MVYLIPLFFTIICSCRYDFNNYHHRFKGLSYVILFLILTLIIGLRYKVGGDSLTYEFMYLYADTLDTWSFNLIHKFQPGFTFLEAISKTISPEFYLFQLLHVSILNILLFIFIFRNSQYRFLSLAVFEYMLYLYFTTEILRESLAVLIFCVIGFPLLQRKQFIFYYISVLFACLFHVSAILLFILPFLIKLKLNKRFIIISITFVVLMFLSSKFVNSFGGSIIVEKINDYTGKSYGILFTFFSVLRGAIFPILFAIFVKFFTKYELKFENYICILCLFGLASVINPLVFGRNVNYLYPFLAISFADYLGHALMSKSFISRNNAVIMMIFFILSYSTQYLHIHQYKRYLPYSSIFNPVEYERDHMKFEK